MRSLDHSEMKKALEFFAPAVGTSPWRSIVRVANLRYSVINGEPFAAKDFRLDTDEAKLILAALNLMGTE